MAFAPASKATLIAYDGFNYPAGGTSLNALSGGSGWINAWDNGGWRTPSTGYGENQATLTFSNLSAIGTSARANGDNQASFRQFGPQTAAGTYWVSFLIAVDSGGGNGGALGVSLFNGGSEQCFMGKTYGSTTWAMGGTAASDSGVAIVGGTSVWVVARYNMDTGKAHFWLNPSPNGVPSDASAWNGSGGTSFTPFSFDRIRLGRYGANGYIDEFSLGTTFADIANTKGVLIAYEGFSYPAGGIVLNGFSGGSGWINAWDNGGWRTPSTGYGESQATLTYSNLSTMGTSARAANDYSGSYRQFGPQTAAGTYWVSFMMNVDSADAANGNSLGVSLFNGGTEINFMGKPSSANWGVAGAGASSSGVAIVGGTNNWIVARYNMDTGKVHFWLNPSPNSVPSDASAWNGSGGTSFTPFSFDRIRLGRYGANGYIDEFSLGTSFAAIANTNGVLITYEGFNYPAGGAYGTSLNTLSGGSGWITTWDNGGWRTPTTTFGENQATLTYSNLSTIGASARAGNDYIGSFRQFGPQTASGIYWVSFLMNVDSGDASNGNSLGVSLFNGGTEINFMGKPSSANWGVAGAGASSSGVAIVGGSNTWIVARYNMDTGKAHFWLNPSPNSVPSDASAWNGPGGTSFTPFSFDRIRLGRFGANGYIDEFRLGTTFAAAMAKQTPSVNINIGTYNYNSSAQGPNSVVTPSTGMVTYSYAGTANDSTSYGPGSTPPTKAGTYTVTATVAPDVNFVSGTSGATVFTINQVSTFVGAFSTQNPSGFKDAVAYTATLPSDATGSVVFSSTNGAFSTNTVSGASTSSFPIAILPRGTNLITVAYIGDGNYLGSTNTLSQIVTNHPPVANPVNYTRNAAINQIRISITNLLTNATDADGDTLSLASVSASTNAATLIVSGGWLMYYNSNAVVDEFTYKVSDGFGGTNSATVTLAVDSTPVFGQSMLANTAGGTATLNFAGIPTYSYSVMRSTNLTTWAAIWATNAPGSGVFQFIDLTAPQPSAYYQLRYNP